MDNRTLGRLLEKVYEAEHDARGLAGALGVSLEGLAGLASERRAAAALRGLCRLADTQAQLVMSRYRVTAAARLVGLATQREHDELARKACVDLLKLELMPDRAGDDQEPPSEPPVDERRVLEALRKIGERGAG